MIKRRFAVAALVITLSVLALLVAFKPGSVGASPLASLASIGERCFEEVGKGLGSTFAEECMKDDVGVLTAEVGPKAVMDALLTLAYKDDRYKECHELTHEIAHAGYQYYSANEVMEAASMECSAGYLDGAAMAAVEAGESDSESGMLALELCKAIRSNGEDMLDTCFHGVGHIIWERSSDNLRAAYQRCRDMVPDGWSHLGRTSELMRAQCVSGVGMSVSELRLKGVRPLSYCDNLLGFELVECVKFVATYDAEVESIKSTLGWCQERGKDVLKGCAGAVGYRLGARGEEEKVYECAAFEVEDVCRRAFNDRFGETG
ncbi:MAG: hypothetical protein ACKOW9_00110 [Candidatus Paceibacterota bacterium]